MYDAETLSQLIGDVYDAALDPSLWEGVLVKAREFVGGFAAALFSKNPTQMSGGVYYDDGVISPHYKQLYFDTYIELDPTTTGHYFADIGQPISTTDLLPYDEFVETRFYKEWVKPQRCVDFIRPRLKNRRRAPPCSAFSATNGMGSSMMKRASICG
jgi:hypothetical protein